MKIFIPFSVISFLQIFIVSFAYSEPLFEKDYKTSSYPETKIIRYRVLDLHEEHKGYALSFTGKIVKGQVTIQIEDTKKNIVEKKEIPAFSLLHWHFILPEAIDLDNIYVSLYLKNAVGNIYSIVAPAVRTQQIYITYIIVFALTLCLIAVSIYIIEKNSFPVKWLFWGILLGICAKILFYIYDYFDFLPTNLLITFATNEQDLSDYIFATYISLRETAILFLLLGIFSTRWLSIKYKKPTATSISVGLTLVFILSIVISGIVEIFQLVPQIQLSPYSHALLSVQASRTPLFYLLIPMRNAILFFLWFSAFYLTVSGTINADKRTVLHGIIIFIVTEAIFVYFEKSSFIYQYSSWWGIVLLILLSFFPLFIFKVRDITIIDHK